VKLVDVSLVITLLAVLAGVFLFIRYRRVNATNDALHAEHAAIREKYGPILDMDAELAKRTEELNAQVAKRDELVAAYGHDYEIHERLKAEVALLEENLEDMSFGVYKPHYNFDAPEDYRKALEAVWQKKKEMVRADRAALCDIAWTVQGSAREGVRMTKQNMKVMLRAFNGEADAAVAKVTWSNVTTMEERIRRAFAAINNTGTVNKIRIVPEYLELSLAELQLTYEYEKKKREVLEEQREIRERLKEEERAQRDFERALQEAATEQERYEKALAKARAEVEKAKGEEIDAANAKVRELEEKLAEAQAKSERAKSMAEQTRCGYIYVISNIGSFGEKVFKIGMTRRLDPTDRVRELGDASVPFQFDVHAMIYSEDAPNLEKGFHRQFAERSVNLVNMRKEFFEIHLDEIEAFAKSHGVTMAFTQLAEAREYRETLALREKAALAAKAGEQKPETQREFPATLTRT
jgi:hypothetical protein